MTKKDISCACWLLARRLQDADADGHPEVERPNAEEY